MDSQFLLELIPQGGFAAFLLWLYLQQKKDTKELRQEAKEDQDKLRERYAVVIADYQKERDEAQQQVRAQVERLGDRITKLENTIAGAMARIENINGAISDIKTKLAS